MWGWGKNWNGAWGVCVERVVAMVMVCWGGEKRRRGCDAVMPLKVVMASC